MCDCFLKPCKVCGRRIPVHLGDFLTDRNEIEVYCWEHLGNLPEGSVALFTFGDADEQVKKDYKVLYRKEKRLIGKTVAFVPLTKNAYRWTIEEEYNHPNTLLPYSRKVRR